MTTADLQELFRLFRLLAREEVRAELAEREVMPAADGLIPIAAAAVRIGMSESYIRKSIRIGTLPSKRIGRAVRVAIADVDKLAAGSSTRSTVTPAQRAAEIKIRGLRG